MSGSDITAEYIDLRKGKKGEGLCYFIEREVIFLFLILMYNVIHL